MASIISPTTRVRVRTHSPLKPFQAWLIIDFNQSIHQFKTSILNLIQHQDHSPNQIILESQGFAFLDQCSCSVIDPVNDLIDVKVLKPTTPEDQSPKKRRRSSTLNSKTTATNVDRPIKPLPKLSTVPPGQGKPQTKARNLRKRIRKAALRQKGSSLVNYHDQTKLTTASIVSTPKISSNSNRECSVSEKQCTKSQTIINQSQSSSNSESSESESESESESASKSESGSSTSSTTESDSSAPSKAPINSTKTIEPRLVPIIQDEQLKMYSLSNKNKRKNNKRSITANFNQPTKIVFGGPKLNSPIYEPSSPGIGNSPSQLDDDTLNTTPSKISKKNHGPPPSLRDPSLIPNNVTITWVDVEEKNWYAGQINFLNQNNQPTTSKRKQAQNRKKQVKRNKRAKLARERDEWDEEMEEAYSEFIGSGGYNKNLLNLDKSLFNDIQSVIENWDKLLTVKGDQIEIGTMIAIKVIELSLQTLTPELTIYHGTITNKSDQSITLNLHPSCLPPQQEEEEEQAIDQRELIKACQREALGQDRGIGLREWSWNEVAEIKTLIQ
ncbi:hypothetical protein CROQUDRAFT_90881 [Cronartium quercuum f. sp. fusiforme G11]|uniref:Coilin n=1 Tax=Cronartium quercuum f. sp. fusiforme G11 TaxID=708437 RepID=A0A9P6NQW5_9BASI|nr:hypothetical protein CROQUDRAFT_90881 [Cronartium quercuum f. sp. fusiforme G11]